MNYYSADVFVNLDSRLATLSGTDLKHTHFNDQPTEITKSLRKWFYFYLNDIVDPIFLQLNGNELSFMAGVGRYIGAYLKDQNTLRTIVEANSEICYPINGLTNLKQVTRLNIPRSNAVWKDESKILWNSYLKGDIRLIHKNKTYDILGASRNYIDEMNTDDYDHPLLLVKTLFKTLVKHNRLNIEKNKK